MWNTLLSIWHLRIFPPLIVLQPFWLSSGSFNKPSIAILSLFLFSFILLLFLIDWWLVYSVGLIFVICQHELAIGAHMPPPPTFSPLPPRLSQSPSSGSLSYTARSHWPPVLRMLAHMPPCCAPFIPPSPTSPPLVHKSAVCVCLLHCCSASRCISTFPLDAVDTVKIRCLFFFLACFPLCSRL